MAAAAEEVLRSLLPETTRSRRSFPGAFFFFLPIRNYEAFTNLFFSF
ncbi:unnamed protein product [Brassica oleracea]